MARSKTTELYQRVIDAANEGRDGWEIDAPGGVVYRNGKPVGSTAGTGRHLLSAYGHMIIRARLIAGYCRGTALLRSEEADHRNGDKLDDRAENLRPLTRAEHAKQATSRTVRILTDDERRVVIAFVKDHGLSIAEAARTFGIPYETAHRTVRRAA